ncbi:MAG: DUF3782 domain-containing protein [Thermodesulfobacteria bacterium]|nr:DUF3782 domain-containing protein [Thermodesulfobacteriota bacterium]
MARNVEVELDEIKAIIKEVWQMWKETDKRMEKMWEETNKRFKETDEKINKVLGLFTSQWGKLVEALVEPGSVKLFNERGIKVNRSARRIKVKDEDGNELMEVDVLLENDNEAVVIEVKTQVKVEDVKEFLEKLNNFKKLFPKYKNTKVYGAIAGIDFEEGADRFAYKNGLFVLKFKEGIVKIANDQKFIPKTW